jgi:hypothetical protein
MTTLLRDTDEDEDEDAVAIVVRHTASMTPVSVSEVAGTEAHVYGESHE